MINKNISDRPTYFLLILFGLILNISLFFAFLSIGKYELVYLDFIGTIILLINIFYIFKNQRIAVLSSLIEGTVLYTVITYILGWEYSFQNWLIALCFLAITVPFPNRKIFYILAVIECVLYFILYFDVKLDFSNRNLTFLTVYFSLTNIIGLFGMILFAEKVLKWSANMEKAFFQDKFERMENIMYTDRLTQLYNRHKADDVLSNIDDNIQNFSDNEHFYIAFVDIDNFKKINDTYGHDIGDDILVMISNILNKKTKSSDMIFRWGGEEFLMLFKTPKGQEKALNDNIVYSILERIRTTVEKSSIIINNKKINTTITLGAASSKESSNVKEIIKLADKKMYEGKNSGKNRVIM
ncbi:diguanylate cyclase (GGDEF) domain protein [Peptoanaerobacter stomatis]|uniref:Diguanylate cyclase (GGDEF) domain protein n=1 Tax=Peptoanaerobacter stomatis TaxID=796937 RepID=J5UAJ1_9FIRM|nr:GGDEF domain-containing protein [Peptoanaerobacter stomatis]EJU21054.1 diguanylate cyclase (GGDEF) domain protein [Peptoanaerobacter stomatis]